MLPLQHHNLPFFTSYQYYLLLLLNFSLSILPKSYSTFLSFPFIKSSTFFLHVLHFFIFFFFKCFLSSFYHASPLYILWNFSTQNLHSFLQHMHLGKLYIYRVTLLTLSPIFNLAHLFLKWILCTPCSFCPLLHCIWWFLARAFTCLWMLSQKIS